VKAWENREFEVKKDIDEATKVYKIEYYKERLQVLENFDNGEFIFAGRLKIKRYYNPSKTHSDPTYYTFHTKILYLFRFSFFAVWSLNTLLKPFSFV
jgi:uncharacterized membrane protein